MKKDKEEEEFGARERPKALWKNAGAKVITANKGFVVLLSYFLVQL